MYRKIKKVSFILILVLSSCNQSNFQLLTLNDVGYWRYEGCLSPLREYSRKDSTFEYYNENLRHDFSGWAWLEMCEHKFRVSNDTIYHYVRYKETRICYTEFTYKIVSLNKNKLRTIHILNEKEKADPNIPNPDTITLFRIKTKAVKRIKKGKMVKFKDCKYEEEAN